MDNPSFFLEGVVKEKNELADFEGPLSLILMLLTKNKIEIRDINISDILDQYLTYLEKMQSLDLEIASEFVQMASHLLYIKTRALLSGEDEEVSELELLMESLEQLKSRDTYAAVQKIVPELRKASEQGMLYYAKTPEPIPQTEREYAYTHEPLDLLRALFSVYSRGGRTPEPDITPAVPKRILYSVRDKSEHILKTLKSGAKSLGELYRECTSRSEIVATFMSVLELISLGSVAISASDDGYRIEYTGGDFEEILDKIVE